MSWSDVGTYSPSVAGVPGPPYPAEKIWGFGCVKWTKPFVNIGRLVESWTTRAAWQLVKGGLGDNDMGAGDAFRGIAKSFLAGAGQTGADLRS